MEHDKRSRQEQRRYYQQLRKLAEQCVDFVLGGKTDRRHLRIEQPITAREYTYDSMGRVIRVTDLPAS